MTSEGARKVSLCLMFGSGFAGLGYQIVWTQQAGLWLGHEPAAMLAVVAAFFGGIAIGALVLGRRIERSTHCRLWYAGSETLIGVWCLALGAAMAPAGEALQRTTGVPASPSWQWGVSFCGTFLLLLPATAAMGATLPAIERIVAGIGAPRSISAHYAANTFGAVLGVLATTFWLVPELGLARTSAICAALNLACAAASVAWLPARSPPVAPSVPSRHGGGTALARLAATGLLGIGYEVLVVRVLSQVCENTVYTFAQMLAVYLVGTAAGAALHAGLIRRVPASARAGLADRLLLWLVFAGLCGAGSLWMAEQMHAALAGAFQGVAGAIAAEGLLALVAFGLPTVAMGAVFAELSATAAARGEGFGRALGVNTLGAALAPLVFGVLAMPVLGPGLSLLAIIAGWLLLIDRAGWSRLRFGLPAGALVAAALFMPPLRIVEVPEGGRVVRYDERAMAAVSVVADADGVMRLRIDNRQQEGSSASGLVDGRMALLPVLLHPAPRQALFLGLGTGVTAATATLEPALQVQAVELLDGVVEASTVFTRTLEFAALQKVRVTVADARRFVRLSENVYDVIISDNFHPARSGSGALYTTEHFAAVRAKLAPGGVFCQWLPLHQLDLLTARSVVRSFLAAFPQAGAILASNSLETPVLGLVGRADDGRFDLAAAQGRLSAAHFRAPPAAFGIDDEYALLGSFVAGPRSLTSFAERAPANTDDRPIVTYRAPFVAYAPDAAPRDRLLTLLHELDVAPGELVARDDGGRLAAYRAARNRFIEIGRNVRPTNDAREMLAQVREPLLSVLRTSPDFRPAYDPLLRMATALARTDVSGAADLLRSLAKVQPNRPEADQALGALVRGGS